MFSGLLASGTILKIALGLVTLANSFLAGQRDKGLKNSGAIEAAYQATSNCMEMLKDAIGIEAAVRSNSDPAYLDRMRSKYSDDR